MTLRILTSFHYFRTLDLAAVVGALGEASGGDVRVFADSGAFSAATLGATVSLADYTAWLRDWQPLMAAAATLDVIGDATATARNTAALEDAGLTVLPTFHVGTPWPVLEDLCSRYRYVALGGMVPYVRRPRELMRWLVRCFRVASHTGTVFHGFGQTNIDIVLALPFYSVDSSTWTTGARYGHLRLWDERRRHMYDIEAADHRAVRKRARLIQDHGTDPNLAAQPGFALRTDGKSDADFHREDAMMRGGNGLAYHRLGQFLTRHHQVPAPPGWNGTGTLLHLADTHLKNFTAAAASIGAHTRKEPLS